MNLEQAVNEMSWYDTHSHMACNEAVGRSGGPKAPFFATACADWTCRRWTFGLS